MYKHKHLFLIIEDTNANKSKIVFIHEPKGK
jgi:hypothetical protein